MWSDSSTASNFASSPFLALGRQVHQVRQALQWIVDLVRQLIRHTGRGRSTGLRHQCLLLPLMSHGHCGKIRKHPHHAAVAAIERLCPFVRHDPDCAARLVRLPRKQQAVRHRRSFDAHQIEKALRHPKQLRTPSLQADPAGAGIAGKHRVQKILIFACCCDPLVEIRLCPLFLLDADTGAVGATQIHRRVHQLLQDRLRPFDERMSQPLQPFHLHRHIADMQAPRRKRRLVSQGR